MPNNKPPGELLDAIASYPHIYTQVVEHWGTGKLRDYLSHLLSDTRGDTRKGFQQNVADAILKLSMLNIDYIESLTIVHDNEFNGRGWRLPKNW